MNQQQSMLTHFLAALAYRTQKALRDAPDDFGTFETGSMVRTPAELIRHMSGVLGYARTFFHGGTYWPEPLPGLADEVARFHRIIEYLSEDISNGLTLKDGLTAERLLQGPLSDAMTHAGQLAMLRRMAGDPVAPENFIAADISSDRLGPDQPLPVCPDEKWPEAPPGKALG